MDSYKENPQASVVGILRRQEVNINETKAALEAAMFSLYEAEGANITAAEQWELADAQYKVQEEIKEKAVGSSNLAANLFASAARVKSCVNESITNVSVVGNNIQVASDNILQLASAVEHAFRIVSAADYDTKIIDQWKEALAIINKTAYNAELLSQHAMETAALTAAHFR